jgi:predicted ATPase
MKIPKIKSLSLKGYKVFDEFKVELNNCNVFVGPNASGKSSIAEFLIFFREIVRFFSDKPGKSDYNYYRNFLKNSFIVGQDKSIEFSVSLEIADFLYEYSVEFFNIPEIEVILANESFKIVNQKENTEIISGTIDFSDLNEKIKGLIKIKGYSFGSLRQEINEITSFLETSLLKKVFENIGKKYQYRFYNEITQFYDFWDDIRFYDFNAYDKDIVAKETGISNELILSEDFSNLMTVLLNLNAREEETFREIKDWLIKLIPSFNNLIIQTTGKGMAYPSFSEKGWNEIYRPLVNASDGLIRLLCIMVILFNKKKPSIILMDVPENGIHPSLRKYIADFSIAASDDSQLIIITHDSESLRQYDLEMIYHFKRDNKYTNVKSLSEEKTLNETIKVLKDVEKDTLVSIHSSDSL